MESRAHDEDLWPYIRSLLPENLDETARETGALLRRRGIRDAEALVRMLLAYGATDLSLHSVATWARAMKLSSLSPPALFYRVRDAERWLSELLGAVLTREVPPPLSKLRLRAVDATVITGPGAEGTEWRVHALAEPGSGRFCAVELTDEHVGEGYGLHPLSTGDVVLGDRGYAYARSIAAANAKGAAVIVRINPRGIRLCDLDRQPLALGNRARSVPKVGVRTWDLLLPIPPRKRTKSHKPWPLSKARDWIPVRVVAARTRKGNVIWVLTTLPPDMGTPEEVMDLYRLRWQVELLFKRLKSLLDLDALPSRQGPTARSWILARLLVAALTQKLLAPGEALSPWGYVLR